MPDTKPTIFLSKSERGVTVSSSSIEDDNEFEKYHIDLIDENHPSSASQEATFNIIRNILNRAGIDVRHE
jgi:hypothetical protein